MQRNPMIHELKMPRRQRGFTLVELMVAITLSLLLLAALSQAFVYNSRDRRELESTSRQIESGRYALRVLSDSFQHAGFYGELDVQGVLTTLPAAIPDPCQTGLAAIAAAMPLHIQGYDDSSGGLSCISDVRGGTDVVVMRHTSTCTKDAPDCNDLVGAPYFQASLCSAEQNTGNNFRLDTDTDDATTTLTLNLRNCSTTAPMRRYLTHIYFVANNDQAGDTLPTLKRAELAANGQFVLQSIANGVENLQIEYGLDANGDGLVESYTSDPGTVAGWRNVIAVKLYLLARNAEVTAGYTDSKAYTLGQGTVVAAPNDAYKRHVYQNSVLLNNPAMRRD